MHNISPRIIKTRFASASCHLEHLCSKYRALHRFRNDMRCQEKPLCDLTVKSESRSDMRSETGCRDAFRNALDKFFFTCNICTGRTDSASGVLDERTCTKIGAECTGFLCLYKFAITVIHEDDDIFSYTFDQIDDRLDIFRTKASSGRISL